MALAGLVIHAPLIPAFTRDFLSLKRKHFPGRFKYGPGLSHILREVKGTEILKRTRDTNRGKRRQASRVRSDLLDLLETYDIKLIGRVWVKEASKGLDPVASYCFAIQDIARHFSTYLVTQGDTGIMICDAREHIANVKASHSVFTDKFRTGGDPIPAIIEAPVFAHSDNHAGLQMCDLIATTMLFPMAANAYCATTATGPHANALYADVRAECGQRLRKRQFMYRDENGKMRGGVIVSDKLNHQSAALMFKAP